MRNIQTPRHDVVRLLLCTTMSHTGVLGIGILVWFRCRLFGGFPGQVIWRVYYKYL